MMILFPVCVIRFNLRPRQITQTSSLIILAIMLNLIKQLLITDPLFSIMLHTPLNNRNSASVQIKKN